MNAKKLRESQRAMADLYVFSAIQHLVEGSTAPSAPHRRATTRIVAICKREMQRALVRMDKADAALKGGE